jgi:hypothetical protein
MAKEMEKLYKQSAETIQYWESWEHEDSIVVHYGVLGEEGETERLPLTPTVREHVEAEAAARRSEGYAPVADDDHVTIIVQYRVEGFGTEADLERRHGVEDLLNNRLGWTGLGHCDGGDIGSGTMNIFCLVVDPDVAVPVILRTLEQSGHREGVTVAIEAEDGLEVRWPPDYRGQFSY